MHAYYFVLIDDHRVLYNNRGLDVGMVCTYLSVLEH